jgi:hypothetical protein
MDAGARFERTVRQVGRYVFDPLSGGRSEIYGGRERDGVYVTDTHIICVEATISQSAKKIKEDLVKTLELIKDQRRQFPDKFVAGYLITQHEPSAEQAEAAKSFKKDNIKLISFKLFNSWLIDGEKYISLRRNYPFGSARDLRSNATAIDLSKTIELDLVDEETGASTNVSDIVDLLHKKSEVFRLVLEADFGSGKSLTLLQIWSKLQSLYISGQLTKLPIFINLRDHSGQDDEDEILERHARKIGYPFPSKLVSAFRCGEVILFLDGFDEISPFARISANSKRLRDLRHVSMRGVRKLIKECTSDVSIFISGRNQYFDSKGEARDALGLLRDHKFLKVSELHEAQVRAFFANQGIEQRAPEWLPGRPLLVGYLVANGLLNEISNQEFGGLHIADAWRHLFRQIFVREADLHSAALKAEEIQLVVERLATVAGRVSGGIGPIERDDILQVYDDLVGVPLDETSEQYLLRLPGLLPSMENPGARLFFDADFADVARAGDVVRFVERPYELSNKLWEASSCHLFDLGAGVASRQINEKGFSKKQLKASLKGACSTPGSQYLAFSLFYAIARNAIDFVDDTWQISDVVIEEIDLDRLIANCKNVYFKNCLIARMVIPTNVLLENMPLFDNCDIIAVIGRSSSNDLISSGRFLGCDFGRFSENMATTSSIMASDLPPLAKVVCSCLEKLFFQGGRGRDESAFPGGLRPEMRGLVKEALELIRLHKFAVPHRNDGKTIWRAERSYKSRAREILSGPFGSEDQLMKDARAR